ncbi:MAG: RagB/SusD family nutrient uptake outer membrane protein [Muribaculaceae bacterium]|nr:RagB/SusD family nutrient uptake outer membrane protein [Muribaculaceae bacterium]
MNKFYIIGAVALTMGLASCDDMLDKEPLDVIPNTPALWSNDQTVESECNRLYNNFLGYGNGQTLGSFYFNALNDDQADPSFANWANTNVPGSSTNWNSPYQEIRGCNYIITNVREYKPASAAKWEGIARLNRAYQYYLLVRCYGDVQWMDRPLGLNDTEEIYGKRDPRDEVMDKVLEDLNFAVSNIGARSSRSAWSNDMAQAMKAEICLYEGTYAKYRTTAENGQAPDAARANKYLNEAANAAKAVMDAGYTLTSDYQEVYNTIGLADCPEVIFFKPYSQPSASFGHGTIAYTNSTTTMKGLTKDAFNNFLFLDGKPLATTSMDTSDKGVWDPDTKTMNIENLLAVRDQRLKVLIDPQLGFGNNPYLRYAGCPELTSATAYTVRKFYTDKLSDYFLKTIGQNTTSAPIFWLAKVMLEYAEAKAELGTLTQADLDATINKLQARAGLPAMTISPAADPANNMGVSPLLWEIRRVRRCELMFNGGRYWDLIRWHQLELLDSEKHPDILLGANLSDVDEEFFWDKKHEKLVVTVVDGYIRPTADKNRYYEPRQYLYPIPSGQIGLNNNLEQNPLWK